MLNIFSFLLKFSEGITASDRLLLFFAGFIYLSLRIILRVALSKKRRDRLYREKALSFGVFWYETLKFFRPRSEFLSFKVPKYNYEFYCGNNREDFINMTVAEEEIIEHFRPRRGDVVVDVGAHIGRYTLIAAKRVGLNG